MIRKAVALVVLIAAGAAAWGRLAQSRDLLIQRRAAVENAWQGAEEALRGRLPVLPELATGASPATTAALRAAGRQLEAARGRAASIAASSALDDAVAQWLVEIESAPRRQPLGPVEGRLREVEYRFATERRNYNSTLQTYNVALEMFPNNLAAKIFGLKRIDAYFITELPRNSPAGPPIADPAGK